MVSRSPFRGGVKVVLLLALLSVGMESRAQSDSLPTLARDLSPAEVSAERPEPVRWMQSIGVEGIYTGMKSRVFNWAESEAVQSAQHHRQLLISVPGANIWQSDAAGLQLGIGVRGLSPSRSSHLSVRQNGMPIAADPLGYPEAYYAPPTRAVREVRMVSGAGALQYGSQLGGMLDFIMRDGREHEGLWSSAAMTAVVYPEALSTANEAEGPRHFFNGFGELGWQSPSGKLRGYAALEQKSGDGWRQNTWFESRTGFFRMGGALSPQWVWDMDGAWMSRVEKQPGGLTDAQFSLDPRASFRDRNHFQVSHNSVALRITNVPSGIRDWLWSARFHGLQARRASLGYLGFPNRVDPGVDRELISGRFRHAGVDLKGVKRWYAKHGGIHALTFGVQALKGNSLAMQGEGTPGEAAVFEFVTPEAGDGSNYVFPNAQLAAHVQAAWSPFPRWVVTPGWRLEFIDTRADGQYRESIFDGAGNLIEDSVFVQTEHRQRAVGLPGLGFSHKFGDLEAYGNAVANYRAINFSDIQLRGIGRKIDPNIRDERGRNVDLGLRGVLRNKLKFDVSAFQLNYRDRIGLYATTIPDPVVIERVVLLRSNIADARTRGVELTIGGVLMEKPGTSTRLEGLLTGSVMKSQYLASEQSAFRGKEVEYVPDYILRSSLIFTHKTWHWDLGVHTVGVQFTEATNAVFTPDAIHGEIPAFGVVDVGFGCNSPKGWSIRCALDNATNAQYFTRRSAAYPGPGILPADGRSLQITVGYQGWQ